MFFSHCFVHAKEFAIVYDYSCVIGFLHWGFLAPHQTAELVDHPLGSIQESTALILIVYYVMYMKYVCKIFRVQIFVSLLFLDYIGANTIRIQEFENAGAPACSHSKS
jgi:hypothetical protein